MDLNNFIRDSLEDYRRRLRAALRGLTPDELVWRPDSQCNPIGFTVWHATRVEDRWIQVFAQDIDDIWVSGGWSEKLGIPGADTGVRYSLEQVHSFPAIAIDDLLGYLDQVREATLEYLTGLSLQDFSLKPGRAPFHDHGDGASGFGEDFDLARMFRQIIGEENQHLGQISYVRGMQRGLNG